LNFSAAEVLLVDTTASALSSLLPSFQPPLFSKAIGLHSWPAPISVLSLTKVIQVTGRPANFTVSTAGSAPEISAKETLESCPVQANTLPLGEKAAACTQPWESNSERTSPNPIGLAL